MSNNYVPPPIDPGLFYWNSDLTEERQLAITAWYRSLPTDQRRMVDDIRREGYEDALYDCRESC